MKLDARYFLAVLVMAAHAVGATPPARVPDGALRPVAEDPRQRPQGGSRHSRAKDFRRPDRGAERHPRWDGRLTDEERKGLRRDIDRANREIYKGR